MLLIHLPFLPDGKAGGGFLLTPPPTAYDEDHGNYIGQKPMGQGERCKMGSCIKMEEWN